jgi:PhnB protein
LIFAKAKPAGIFARAKRAAILARAKPAGIFAKAKRAAILARAKRAARAEREGLTHPRRHSTSVFIQTRDRERKRAMSPTTATTSIQPYLFFGGRCEEALDFYRAALGAEIGMVMLFKDSPEPPPPGVLQPGFENKVMHASFRIAGNLLLASDGCTEAPGFKGFALSLSVPTEAEAERAFASLADGGQVCMPMRKTFWSPCFGMLTDRFGVGWMVSVEHESSD